MHSLLLLLAPRPPLLVLFQQRRNDFRSLLFVALLRKVS